jgi:hypothetical protein
LLNILMFANQNKTLFQTQDIMNAAKLVADVRAQSYLDQLKATPGVTLILIFTSAPQGIKLEKVLMQIRLQLLLLTGRQPRTAMNIGNHKPIDLA